jgi:predicted nucleic acid-binding protein
MLIYLDLCCFNRPFDEQSNRIVRLQTEAKLCVQAWITGGRCRLAWSTVIDLENRANPDRRRRSAIHKWRSIAHVNQPVTYEVELLARDYVARGLKPMDALHVACAIIAGVEFFLTVDKTLMRKMRATSDIFVLDPIDFIKHLEGIPHENRQ